MKQGDLEQVDAAYFKITQAICKSSAVSIAVLQLPVVIY